MENDLFRSSERYDELARWRTIASPKPSAFDKRALAPWVNLYAAFSEAFATEALRILGATPGDKVVDPFIGSGTTIAAANSLGLNAIGIDLDPFSAVIARSRLSNQTAMRDVMALFDVESKNTRSPQNSLTNPMFCDADFHFALEVLESILKSTGIESPRDILQILECEDHRFDCEIIALAGLTAAANNIAAVGRGSNPVWLKTKKNNLSGTARPIKEVAAEATKHFLHLASSKILSNSDTAIQVFCADARNLPLGNCCADYVLTSPPYLNRLDYVVKHSPAIAMLNSFRGGDFDHLRRQMIGTTKINAKVDEKDSFGEISREVLNKILHHESYASQSYYYWTYLQYFISMRAVFMEIERILKVGGSGVIVVQDSYYKDFRIPIDGIFIELASGANLQACVVRTENVKSHMGRMSPTQQKHNSAKVLQEYVIHVKK